ncbi:MAG TPA: hypothetical protein VFF06_31990 [Polyangia bacterium]|nr:hypothetical protein [Polyangia bacterium]
MRWAAAALLAAGCSAALPAVRPTAEEEARGRAMAEAACRAHGGADWRARWRAIGGVRAHVRIVDPLGFYPADGNWLLDPARNRALVRFWSRRGPVEWRYDGARATILVGGACSSTPGERRLIGGLVSNFLYWFGVPFKFLDEGAHPSDAGGGRFLVTYRGVGETPDDWFLAETDAAGRLARITYVSSVLSRYLQFRGEFRAYRDFGGFAVATERSFGARSQAARGVLAPVEHHVLDVETGLALDDAFFAAPPGCDP